MSVKHTAGRWEVNGEDVIAHRPGCRSTDGLCAGFTESLCSSVVYSGDNGGYGAIGSEADARLISAAPDLLAALHLVLASTLMEADGHDWRTCDQPSCKIARAAIAKAEGSEQ